MIEKSKVVKRKPGRLYYVDGKGNLCSSPMKRSKKKTTKKTKKRRR